MRPSPDRKRLLPEPNCATRGKPQFVGDAIPTIASRSQERGAGQARGSQRFNVIIEIDKYRSDWIEWSEVKSKDRGKERGDERDDLKKKKSFRQN